MSTVYERICSHCNRKFEGGPGQVKKCWVCQGYAEPPAGYHVYNKDGSEVTIAQAEMEKSSRRRQ